MPTYSIMHKTEGLQVLVAEFREKMLLNFEKSNKNQTKIQIK